MYSREISKFFLATAIFICLILNGFRVAGQVVINEIFITNSTKSIEKITYNYSNWIEIYNPTNNPVFLGNYYITSDLNRPFMYKFKYAYVNAKDYVTYYLGDYNANSFIDFKLPADGGVVAIVDAQGKVVDKVFYKQQYENVSSGRYPDGSANWLYFAEPTYNKSNSSEVFDGNCNNPNLSPGGFYDGTITVTISSADNSAQTYYTTNGATPTPDSKLYTGSFQVSKTTVVRAKSFKAGKIPSQTVSQTYFVNEHKPTLPVISIVTDSAFLWDNMIGIYVRGKNGLDIYGSNGKANWNQDWERAANIEYYSNKKQVINQLSGIKISGAWSRNNPQKSLSLYAKGKYSQGKFKYKFFNKKEIYEFDALYLRNSGNDFNNTLIRDDASQALTDGQMSLDHLASQNVAVYINGQYWGEQSLKEKSNQDYPMENYNISEDSLDYLELDGSVPVVGSNKDYYAMLSFVQTQDMSLKSNYEYVKTLMDMDEYIDYNIHQIYASNGDWPANNIKYWKPKKAGGKWRWLMYDNDFCLGAWNGYSSNVLDSLLFATVDNWPYNTWSLQLFRGLMKNNEFKQAFINRMYSHINSTYSPQRVIGIIDSLFNAVKYEMPYHIARWNVPNYNINWAQWGNNVEWMRVFARNRPAVVRDQFKKTFGLGDDVNIVFTNHQPYAGYLKVNNVTVYDSLNNVFYKNAPVTITAIPYPGFKLNRIERNGGTSSKKNLISKGSVWKYSDTGVPDNSWKDTTFNDNSWLSGPSELGYGDGGEATVLNYGADANNKRITYYFRQTFNFTDTGSINNLVLNIMRDDGAVVYINGNEVIKSNMPNRAVYDTTLALTAAVEDTFYSYQLLPSWILKGENTIAVEIHQNAASSSDVSFNMELVASVTSGGKNSHVFYTDVVNDTAFTDTKYIAYFDTIAPKYDLIINELAAVNGIYTDEYNEKNGWVELYNNANQAANIAGLRFTGSSDVASTWVVPSNNTAITTIAPKSYKVLWADAQPLQGALHLGFELSPSGENLKITQLIGKNEVTIDEVHFSNLYGNHSYGRYPDLTGPVKLLYTPTPGKANVDDPFPINNVQYTDNKGVSVYNDNSGKVFYIKLPDSFKGINLLVFDITGKQIFTNKLSGSSFKIDLTNYPTGVYIIKGVSVDKSFVRKVVSR